MTRFARLAFFVIALFAIACGKSGSASGNREAPMQGTDQIVTVLIYSGRAQPPPETTKVHIGTPVSIQLVGLGPPHADVFGPDGAPIDTIESRLIEDSGFSGTRQRFTPNKAGIYRVESRSATGFVYARIDAS